MKEKSVNLLLIEDNPEDAELIKALLLEATWTSFCIEVVPGLAEGCNTVAARKIDVVLLDLSLPDSSGLDSLFETLAAAATNVAIIVLTGLDNEKIGVKAVRKGAQDYLIKGKITADSLSRSVRYSIERKRMEVELQKARDIAEAANLAKSEFLAVISHELLTPLNPILGFTEMLQKDREISEEKREYLQIVSRSARHLLMIINDVIDFSRIEAGKVLLKQTVVNLPEFLEKIVDMIQIQSQRKGLCFTADIPPDLPVKVHVDERRLRQILINILGNAVRFTHKGEIRFRVINLESFNKEPQNKKSETQSVIRLRFQVEDTGIGIPPDHLEKIFSSFHQVELSINHTEGTGLGLAISQRMARMMGSTLHVSSTVGKGSTFWFDIDLYAPKI